MPASREFDRALVTRMPRALDPRTGLLLVVACSAAVMNPSGVRFAPAVLILGWGLSAWEGAWRRLGVFVIAVGATLTIGWLLPAGYQGPVTGICAVGARYLLCVIAAGTVATHVAATSSAGRMSAAFRTWRIPRPITVTLVLMVRFIPVVAIESRAVLDAMRLRGLTGATVFLRHPVLGMERFVVPMIAASLRASEDLSASAILRGMGSRTIPTCLSPLRFRLADGAVVAVALALCISTLVAPEALS